jgi:hypothetical protein
MNDTPFEAPEGATISTCFRVVLDLARQGILDDSDPGMAYEVLRQTEAVDRLEALLDGCSDDLDLMTEDYDGLAFPLCDKEGFTKPIDLDDIRSLSPDYSMDAMAISLELACQQVRDEEEDGKIAEIDGVRIRVGDALDLAAAFWEIHHEDIRDLDHSDLDIYETMQEFEENEGPDL